MEIEVVSVRECVEGPPDEPEKQALCWRVVSVDEEGLINEHLMPQNIVAWRIAEFDLDPEDSEGIWDLILHERLVSQLDPEDLAAIEPAPQLRRGSAPSASAQALEIHRAKIELAKEKVGRVRITPDEPAARGARSMGVGPLSALLDYRAPESEVEGCRQWVRAARGEVPDPRLPTGPPADHKLVPLERE